MRRTRWQRLLAVLPFLAALALAMPLTASAGAMDQRDGPRDLVVLAYHEIADADQATLPNDAITPAAFEAQIGWLTAHGHHFVSIDQVIAADRGRGHLPPNPILLSFDDGDTSVYTAAFPVLQRHRIPAVVAVVGSWLEPTGGPVHFGDDWLARDRLLSWAQLRTMQRSGLVEVASHSDDLHHGINGNPQGHSMPAATTRQFSPGQGYETEDAYRRRLWADLEANGALLQHQLGHRPRVIVWPYG